MRHLKRQKVPKKWPVSRKGTTYLVKPSSNVKNGVPLLVLLRDVLKAIQTKRELRKAIHNKNVLINSRKARDDKEVITLFDTFTLVPSKKTYKMVLAKTGKYDIEEISEKDAETKVAKILDKKTVKGKKTQINLSDGRNYLTEEKCNVNDSVVLDFKNKKVSKCLPLKEKSKAIVFEGKHTGETGVIEKIDTEHKMVDMKSGDHTVKVLIKQIMVLE